MASEINPLNAKFSSAQFQPVNLAQVRNASTPAKDDVDQLIALVSARLAVSGLTAYRIVREFIGSGYFSGTFEQIRNLFEEKFLKQLTPGDKKIILDLEEAISTNKTPQQVNTLLKPLIGQLKERIAENRINTPDSFNRKQVESHINYKQLSEKPVQLTSLVTSPQAFASWLVNNKAAFIALRSNPLQTYLLTALQNPQIQQSPILFAELFKLIAQVLRLKTGKSLTEDVDEEQKQNIDQIALQESLEHQKNIVNNVNATTSGVAVNPLRDFLIEAERFAEEEIANLWSITLKKEKELEKKIKERFDKFQNKKNV